jgi:hypothetical protein
MRGLRPLLSLALIVGCTSAFCNVFGNACFASDWQSFSDPAHEFTIDMPAPVITSTKSSQLPQYESKDGECSYTVSVNQRSKLSEDEELEVFAREFAETFERSMKKSGYPTVRSVEEKVAGANWRGKLYQFDKPDGSKTTIQVCVEDKHNIILYVFGGALEQPKTVRFLNSLEVH